MFDWRGLYYNEDGLMDDLNKQGHSKEGMGVSFDEERHEDDEEPCVEVGKTLIASLLRDSETQLVDSIVTEKEKPTTLAEENDTELEAKLESWTKSWIRKNCTSDKDTIVFSSLIYSAYENDFHVDHDMLRPSTLREFGLAMRKAFPSAEFLEVNDVFYVRGMRYVGECDIALRSSTLTAITKNFVCLICKQSFNSRTILNNHLHAHIDGDLNPSTEGLNTDSSSIIEEMTAALKTEENETDVDAQLESLTKTWIKRNCILDKSTTTLYAPLYSAYQSDFRIYHDLLSSSSLSRFGYAMKKVFPSSAQFLKINGKFYLRGVRYVGEHDAIETRPTLFVMTKNFVCQICKMSFHNQGALDRHILKHTNERPFACDLCEKRFKIMSDLKRHKSTHSEEKPFVCHHCEKRFAIKIRLREHQKRHDRKESEKKPFICSVCGMNFKTQRCLTAHLRKESEEKLFICNVCTKGFKYQWRLTDHLRRHADVRPFLCDTCEKRFKSNSELRDHKFTHSDEKPYECDICFKKFAQKRFVRMHKVNVHRPRTNLIIES